MNKTKKPRSLRTRLLTAVLLCWILPVLSVVILAGILLGRSYERSSRQELESRARNAIEQLEIRMDAVFEASKSVSYDGVVRNAYRLYQRDGDSAALYRTVTEYLNQNFTRDERILAAFLSFWEEADVRPYAAGRGDLGFSAQREYRDNIEADILEKMSDEDTGILLLEYGGELYIARNLLDSHFRPYASVVLLCDQEQLFQSLDQVRGISTVSLLIDGNLLLDEEKNLHTAGIARELGNTGEKVKSENTGETAEPGKTGGSENTEKPGNTEGPQKTGSEGRTFFFDGDVSGHSFRLCTVQAPFNVWRDVSGIRWVVGFVVLLVLPMLTLMIYLFRRYVTKPVEILGEANSRLEAGERGYTIEAKAESQEFARLYANFNAMSTELKNQFERSYQEQQALQQARIKALQSQINPHFLNNTLEIINWEARLANDERVSAMIEALSTMMNGVLGRDGRSRIPLKEELGYVDAYLYIIRERLGERLEIRKELDESLMEALVPRLVLQPLAENAVEHDITPRRGGILCLRAYREGGKVSPERERAEGDAPEGGRIVLEVEHDGTMSEEDLAAITAMLSASPDDSEKRGRVGLRNVRQRLKLLYGEEGELILTQSAPDRILAQISFPADQ